MSLLNASVYFLHIYAKPKSYQDKIDYWLLEGTKYVLQLRITAPPQGGKANKAIIILLAKKLDIPKSSISLVSGPTTRHKIFKIAPWSLALAKKLPRQPELPTLF